MAGRKAQAISNYCTRHGVEFEVEEYLRILEEAHVDLVRLFLSWLFVGPLIQLSLETD